ncbi:MAG: hypothetical protein HY817_02830 [Candidatus Abawacabacteria bacterium]|nr:hypothetical protein [Candidatus Abawacabacteria bacterium]
MLPLSYFATYLVQNGFTTQGFHVPDFLASRTDFLSSGSQILNWILGFVGTVAFLIILWAGLTMVTSAGNSDRIKKARSALIYTFIGIVIIAVSYVFVQLITWYLSPANQATIPPSPAASPRVGLPVTNSTVPLLERQFTVVATPSRR